MLPCFTGFNSPDITGKKSKLFSNNFIWPDIVSYRKYLCRIEFCLTVSFPALCAWGFVTPFLHRILHIISMRAHKKVSRICTLSIIAFMANMKSSWNFAKMYLPTYPMHVLLTALKAHLGVAIGHNITSPFPASARAAANAPKEFSDLLHRKFVPSEALGVK